MPIPLKMKFEIIRVLFTVYTPSMFEENFVNQIKA